MLLHGRSLDEAQQKITWAYAAYKADHFLIKHNLQYIFLVHCLSA